MVDPLVQRLGRGLVGHAGHHLLLRKAARRAGGGQGRAHVAGLVHVLLAVEEGVQDREVIVRPGAAGGEEGRGGHVHRLGEELAEHVTHLAGVDVLGLEVGEDVVVEAGAVRAAGRAVLDHRDLGLRVPRLKSSCVAGAAAARPGQAERERKAKGEAAGMVAHLEGPFQD